MKKQILSISLALALLLGLLCFPAQAAVAAYSDVSGHWAEAAISKWSGYGVVEGSGGTFRPDAPLTRAELAAVLDRVMGYREQAENTFSDLPAAWYTPAMLRLNAAGVLEGSNGSAMPMGTVTRQEAAVLLGRAFQVEASGKELPFTDFATVASWAKGYVSALAEAGHVQGYQGAFAPTDSVTRASLVTMLDNMVSGFVHEDDVYSADAAGSLVVNAANVTLKDMSVGGDLIIADGVGDGDVYLDNVKVTGRVILRGCGENSFHVLPGTDLSSSTVIVCKTASGGIRLVNESGAPIPMVNVADGKDGVTLTGPFGGVVIASDAPVALKDATVSGTVSVTASGASLSVTGKSEVARLDVAEAATGASLTVDKEAALSSLVVSADGLILDGKAENVTVSGNVKDQPQTPGGKPAGGGDNSGGSSGGGGGGNGGGNTPSIQTLTAVTANLASPQAGKTATGAVPGGAGYTVTTTWSPALIDGKFALDTAYTATLAFTPAAYYQWPAEAPAVTVNNSTAYGSAPTVSAPVLADGKVTVTASYSATGKPGIVLTRQPDEAITYKAGYNAPSLDILAHVETDGVQEPNYLISYQWYTADAADKTGASPVVSAVDNTYILSSNLALGTYYYFCRISADGCDSVDSVVSTINVVESGDDEVLITNMRLEGYSGTFRLIWDYSNDLTSDGFYFNCYTDTGTAFGHGYHISRGNSQTGDSVPLSDSIALAYDIADNTYLASTTIHKIELTPRAYPADKQIGPTAALNCQIEVTSNGIVSLSGIPTLDESTAIFTIADLPSGYDCCNVTILDKYGEPLSWFRGSVQNGTITRNMQPYDSHAYTALKTEGAQIRIILHTSQATDATHATMQIAYTVPIAVTIQNSDNG